MWTAARNRMSKDGGDDRAWSAAMATSTRSDSLVR